jgi:DNA-binding NtrC family response regulator
MHESTSVNRKDILVVDDVPAIRALLSDFLATRGYCIETAATVHDAHHHLGNTHFSLVITNLQLDRNLPMSGCDVVRHAKNISPPLPVIVITGGASSDTVSRVSKLGADVFLSKPIALGQLHRFVEELLGKTACA